MSDTSDFEGKETKFERAAAHLQKIVSELDQATLLLFYGLYKQATIGKCNIPKPGIFSLQAKAKWNAWNDLNDMTEDVAMNRYIDAMDKLKPGWDEDSSDKQTKEQWVSVSTFQINEDDNIEVANKSFFDYVKEGDLVKLSEMDGLQQHLNDTDDEGLGLIHWASDRGNVDVLQFLLISGADVNLIDSEGQTALHYASFCGHSDCIKLLIKFGADRTIKDKSLLRCVDVAEDSSIAELLRS